VTVEPRPEGILLKSVRDDRLTWEETAQAMAAEQGGEFADWEKAEGLKTGQVAEIDVTERWRGRPGTRCLTSRGL
jgi:hypothetical protein